MEKKFSKFQRLNLHLPQHTFSESAEKLESQREKSLILSSNGTPSQNNNAFRFFDKRKGSLKNEIKNRTKMDSHQLYNVNTQLDLPQESIVKNLIYYEPQNLRKNKKTSQLSDQIRTIEEQIKRCQKSIEGEYQLQKSKRSLQGKGSSQDQNKSEQYDFITNPFGNQLIPAEEQSISEQIDQQIQKIHKVATLPYINPYLEIQKLESIYHKEIEKAFFRKENIGLFSKVKQKVPRLKITKENKISKEGEAQTLVEHNFRVFTHERTPCVPQPILPSFQKRKDVVTEYILDYLKNNQSEGKVEKLPKYIRNLVQNPEPGLGENQQRKQHKKILKTAE